MSAMELFQPQRSHQIRLQFMKLFDPTRSVFLQRYINASHRRVSSYVVTITGLNINLESSVVNIRTTCCDIHRFSYIYGVFIYYI